MIVILVLILEFVFLTVLKSTGIMDVGDVVATFLIIFVSIIFYASIRKDKCLNKYRQAIIIGYLLRIIFLYFDRFGNWIYLLPNSGADTEMFYNQASNVVLTGRPGRESSFLLLLTRLFNIIGVNRLYGQYLLMLLSIAAITITIRTIDKTKTPEESKQYVAYILNLLPNFAILSSIFLRESLVTLFITISACMMVNWMKEGRLYHFIVAVSSSIIACLYHSGSIGITIGCILCMFVYDKRKQKIHMTGSGFIFALAFALVASYFFLKYGNALMGKYSLVDSIEDIANTSEMGGSSYAKYVGNSNNPINMLVFSIPRIVYFLFSPFPWQWRGVSDIIAFVFSALFYLAVIKDTFVFLRSGAGENRGFIISLLLLAFFTTFIFAWGVSNTGTAARHRDKMVCLFALIMALARPKEKNKITVKETEKQEGRNSLSYIK